MLDCKQSDVCVILATNGIFGKPLFRWGYVVSMSYSTVLSGEVLSGVMIEPLLLGGFLIKRQYMDERCKSFEVDNIMCEQVFYAVGNHGRNDVCVMNLFAGHGWSLLPAPVVQTIRL